MGHHMKTLAIVQARMCSTRFPNKVMLPINDVPLIELLLHLLSLAKLIDHIMVATSIASGDKQLAAHVRSLNYEVFEGSENNVLDRFYKAALPHRPNMVVKIAGDCPLVDPELVGAIIASFAPRHVDYLTEIRQPSQMVWIRKCTHKARWKLDEPADLAVVDAVFRHFGPRINFG